MPRMFVLVHSNLWTSPISSMSGLRYYVLFWVGFTYFLWAFPFVPNLMSLMFFFSKFHAYVQTHFQSEIKLFQCDNGREFNNQSLITFFSQ